ncbi:hypothetical protein [Stutzerimonas stutzeri]|uniref:hypothetical protein n=1 Tax=Stutzerimonas stutzeri TaxID=316 RepID=UPI003B7D2E05
MPHSLLQKVNYFAQRAFRETADKDYIHARMAYRAGLFPQFHWSSLHALEKYAKCIALLTRIPRPSKDIKHEIKRSLELISTNLEIETSTQTDKFIERLEKFGAQFRYLEVSWFIHECELAYLDRAVWEIRRFCNSALYTYCGNDFASVKADEYEKIKLIDRPTFDNTYIPGGFIEKTLENKHSNSRPYLTWCNLYYSNSKRTSVRIKSSVMAENSPFYLFPEIIDEVSKYAFVPKNIRNAYQNG